MSTQPHDEALHPREQSGKFATKPVTEVAGGLDALGPVAEMDLEESDRPAELARVVSRAAALQSQLAISDFASGLRALALGAATITMSPCCEDSCEILHVDSIHNSAGDDLFAGADDGGAFQDRIVGAVDDAEVEIPDAFELPAYFTIAGDRRMGHTYTLDINAAIASRQADKPQSAERAAATISGYRAMYDDMEIDDETAARDMLTDLYRWAEKTGVDFDDLVARAARYGAEESEEGIWG